MGVISVGASLGVAEKAALRPSASPSAAAAQASATAAPGGSNSGAGHAATQRRHEYAHANHHHYNNGNGNSNAAMGAPSQSQQAPHSGRNKRGGRRKYVPSNPSNLNGNGNSNSISMVPPAPPVQIPPPPIITALGAAPAAASASAPNRPFVGRTSPAGAPAPHAYASPLSAQVVRSVAFQTNVDPQLLMPLLVGAKSGSKLHTVMAQAKCSISIRPAHPSSANGTGRCSGSDETVIRISPFTGNGSHRTDWRLIFTITAETVKRVDHGIRLLQGAIEGAERKINQKQSAVSTAGAAASWAVDSGGNSIPSSGHVSASSAIVDHSIDYAPLPSVELLNRAASSSSSTSSTHNRDSVDERKAQTRIRYPPTNQPLERGPGFASSRIISESSTTVEARSSVYDGSISSTGKAKSSGKKRQLPSVGDEIADRSDAKKRERTRAPAHDMTQRNVSSDPTTAGSDRDQSSENVTVDESSTSEFDEFRIRMTRGIAFSRQVEVEAAEVRRRLRQEKNKHLKMIQRAQRVNHQQRVADVVIRTQCAIMATSESNGKKRRRIEQLSAAQESLVKTMSVASTVKRMHMGTRSTPLPYHTFPANPVSSPYSDLLKKIAKFRALVSTKQVSKTGSQQEIEKSSEVAVPSTTNQYDKQRTTKDQDVPDICEKGPTDNVVEDSKDRGEQESFRSLFVAPGVPRDMNLIQDYTDESECGLLRVLIGQRQYFYLEPVTLSFGSRDLEKLTRDALRSAHDLDVLRTYVLKNRRFGSDLMKSIETIVSSSIQAMASSKAVCWTSMQHTLLDLHPLLLALHLLALHYHTTSISNHRKVQSKISTEDILCSDGDISSDLFKFVLRPIRSSAIESSLHDTLPISLVRETIAHCPEVVNHVLDWREEHDVPAALLQDVSNLKNDKTASGRSELLNDILKQLQRHSDDFDRSLSELSRHLHGNWNMGISGDKVIYLVNQLKSIAAHILVANTRLQLHKWTTVFVENGFTWFDEDLDDDAGNDVTGDRSYDKFTCLQDALVIWHKEQVQYSARDTKIGDLSANHCLHNSQHGEKTSTMEPEREEDPQREGYQSDAGSEDREPVDLRRITPPEVMSAVESLFTTRDAVASFVLTSNGIDDVRKQFDDSINAMRASMKVLGRTAPWRTHVKHSNALKVEYKKQRELEKQLLLHQWAVYYRDRPLPDRPNVDMEDISLETTVPESEPVHGTSADQRDHERNQDESNGEELDTAAPIVIEAGDTPEVVDMKMLRHEIESVAKQMQSIGAATSISSDRKRLIDACNLLASSCVSALSKFLDKNEASETKSVPSKSAQTRTGRQRANSTSKLDSSSATLRLKGRLRAESVTGSNDYVPRPLEHRESARQSLSEDTKGGDKLKKRAQPQSPSPPDVRKPSFSEGAHRSSPIASVSLPSGRVTKPTSAHSTTSSHTVAVSVAAEPLRMGCSGCRDTRRRCTGCHGCCLHCVCTGCGCRMCCSSRATVVQKTLNLLVSAVETRMGCKWIALDARIEKSERCGMVKVCELCQQCSSHCACHPAAQAAASAAHRSATTTAGFPNSSSRKERRFRINPTAAHRRQAQGGISRTEEDVSESKESGTTSRRPSSASRRSNDGATSKRTRRSNSDASVPPVFSYTESMDSTADFTDFPSGSSNDVFPFVSTGPLPSQHKDEQEDLFRAARVRMKLQRNTFLKAASHPFGSIPPNTLIEGDVLWQPGRIRLMWERKDVYGVLGVPRDASPQLIKKQYRKLVLKLHPDKVFNNSDCDQNHVNSPNQGDSSACSMDERVAAFVAVTQAYKLLSGEIGAIHTNAWKTTV